MKFILFFTCIFFYSLSKSSRVGPISIHKALRKSLLLSVGFKACNTRAGDTPTTKAYAGIGGLEVHETATVIISVCQEYARDAMIRTSVLLLYQESGL